MRVLIMCHKICINKEKQRDILNYNEGHQFFKRLSKYTWCNGQLSLIPKKKSNSIEPKKAEPKNP